MKIAGFGSLTGLMFALTGVALLQPVNAKWRKRSVPRYRSNRTSLKGVPFSYESDRDRNRRLVSPECAVLPRAYNASSSASGTRSVFSE
jgi:hypothetical protein